jgi:hypothetical protein
MKTEDRIKLFGMSQSLVERELDKVEQAQQIDLQRQEKDDKDEDYYPQFDLVLRTESAQMAKHYEVFYCLEKSIRKLISETLESSYGENWWELRVPDKVKENVKTNMQREIDSGICLRSEHEIDFSNFGELGEIVRSNWDDFDAIFTSEKAFSKIMTSLNMLRNPIAHCCPMAEDEVIRLQLTLRDWFRLME